MENLQAKLNKSLPKIYLAIDFYYLLCYNTLKGKIIMKKFRFQYSPIVWILISIILIMCILGFGLNIINLTEQKLPNSFKVVSYSVLAVVTFGLAIFSISLLFYGRYVIKKGYLYIFFGFIRSKININDIVCITHFKKSDKLVIYLKEQSYSVIVISKDNYDKFVHALREQNAQILYDTKIDNKD